MATLLTEKEREKILHKVRKQRFGRDRRNVLVWWGRGFLITCTGVLWVLHYVAKLSGLSDRGELAELLMLLLLAAMFCWVQWERYKELALFQELLREREQGSPE